MPYLVVLLMVAVVLTALLSRPAASGYRLTSSQVKMIKREFGQLAGKYESKHYPAAFLLAIIGRESQGIRTAKGRDGEYGIFQIMPYHFPLKLSEKDRWKVNHQFEVATRTVLSNRAWLLIKAGKFSFKDLAAMYNGGPGGYKNSRPQAYGRDVVRLMALFEAEA